MQHFTISSLKGYKDFLLDDRSGLLYDLTIIIPIGKEWVLPEIKWVHNLTILTNGKSKHPTMLTLPDLKLVVGTLDVSAAVGIELVNMPVLEEVRTRFKEPEWEGQGDFFSVDGKYNISMPNSARLWDNERWEVTPLCYYYNLANDGYYTLRFELDLDDSEGAFVAGCRKFTCVDAAIAHWTKRFEESTNDDDRYSDGPTAHRALMFVFALTNFKEEMKRGGLI